MQPTPCVCQCKESGLQDLLEAKALALSQSDRLLAQYRVQRAQAEAEVPQTPAVPPSSSSPAVSTSILSLSLSLFQASKLGALLKEAERRCEQQGAELSAQVLEVQRSRADLEELLQHNGRLQQDSEEHQVLRGAYNALLNRSEGGVTAAAATYQLQYTHHTTVPLVFECNTFFHFQCNRSIPLSNI